MINKIDINGGRANVLYQFKVLLSKWESDDKGYLVEQDGKHFMVLTDNGYPYVATEKEIRTKMKIYKKKIKTYNEALSEAQYALDQLITEKAFEQ